MKQIFLLTVFLLSSFAYGKRVDLKNAEACLASREFITVYRYLQSKEVFTLSIEKKIKLSKNVASYCNGAANRFFLVSEILLKAGVDPSKALTIASKKAQLNDATVDGFLTVFKESFLTNYLDMSLSNALKLADSITEIEHASGDEIKSFFKEMFDFCLHSDYLKLGKPTCADFVSESLKMVSLYEGASVAESFEKLTEFIQEHDSLIDNKHESLKLIQTILSYGPGSADNFIKAYQFAIDSEGLKLAKKQALNFAKEMAQVGRIRKTN